LRQYQIEFLTIQNRRIEFVRLPSAHPQPLAPAIVFLHEGLGSLAMWRDFPQRVADATGCEAIVYSRNGYGRSAALSEPHRPDYMHHEALAVLPELLDQLAAERPILFGHSDGGSIALIHAGAGLRPVDGVIVMAPHVMVEDIAIAGIEKTRAAYLSGDLRQRLAKYHDHPDAAFRAWHEIWLDPQFRSWNIEAFLPRIACPVLAIQGDDDEYASVEQIERIARQAPTVELLKLAACGHSPQRDQAQMVIAAVAAFVETVFKDAPPPALTQRYDGA
jgi:pimeloyl-ACP methyl ester carboxylesterase